MLMQSVFGFEMHRGIQQYLMQRELWKQESEHPPAFTIHGNGVKSYLF